jgi:RNA polymerase sigma-70 factor (ECF subfamily)
MGKRSLKGHEYSDSDLVKRCAGGDIRSQEYLYRRYFSFAMSVCIRYAREESEAMEIVNDSYMKVLDRLSDYDPSRPFKNWYGKILVNTAIDTYRKNLRDSENISIDTITDNRVGDPEIETDLSVNDILKLFSYLPANYRITFNLYELEGYSHEEIGQMMGITASASRANLARAKKMLRELYDRHIIQVKKGHEEL